MIHFCQHKGIQRRRSRSKWLFAVVLCCLLALSLSSLQPASSTESTKKIVIDPGHGKVGIPGDSKGGAVGPTGLKEYIVNFEIATRLAALINGLEGWSAILTKLSADANPRLRDRANTANSQPEADLFISIHCNDIGGNSRKIVYGCEAIYYKDKNYRTDMRQQQSHKLATYLYGFVKGHVQTYVPGYQNWQSHRKAPVYPQNVAVLRLTTMPAALIEVAYIYKEENLLGSTNTYDVVAQALLEALQYYFQKYPKSSSSSNLYDSLGSVSPCLYIPFIILTFQKFQKRPKLKRTLLSFGSMLILVMTISANVAPSHGDPNGPWANSFLANIYLNAYAANTDLEAGYLDVNDWPLDKYWIDKWTGNPDITMRSYAGSGMFQFDLNNKRWPTSNREFRQALAYLTDKDHMIDWILKGYGYRLDTMVPFPFLYGYTDYADLEAKGLIYHFNVANGQAKLDEGGFALRPDGIRQDPLKPSDPSCPGYHYPLDPLIFYARMDDPTRSDAAGMLAAQLEAVGVPVDLRVTAKGICLTEVMVRYDYHIYTGNWGDDLPLQPDLYRLTNLYHSAMYWYPIGWSVNYIGYENPDYDYFTEDVMFAASDWEGYCDAKVAALGAQEVMARDAGVIPLWCSAAFKAYRSKWAGMVNTEGIGVDNGWSFFNMENAVGDTIIDWGFSSYLEGPHVIHSSWSSDWQLLDLIYDSLVCPHPFCPIRYCSRMATDTGTTGIRQIGAEEPWEWESETWVKYTLRNGMTFHDGAPVTTEDVKYSIEFTGHVGEGVGWNHPIASSVDRVDTQAQDPTLGPYDIKVYFRSSQSFWDLYHVGLLPILNKDVWQAADAQFGWGYGTDAWDPVKVMEYHPWEMDANSNGAVDLEEDGAGPWIMDGTSGGAPGTWTWVNFNRNTNYYWTQEYVSGFITQEFHKMGNVNYEGAVNSYPSLDLVIDILDGAYVRNSFGSTPAWPPGTESDKWNRDCDFDEDNEISTRDLWLWGSNYGRIMG